MTFLKSILGSTALAAGLVIAGLGAASARDLTVVSWGGNYQDAQRKIYFKPFADKTGKPVLDESWDGGVGVVQAKVKAGTPNWDAVQVEAGFALAFHRAMPLGPVRIDDHRVPGELEEKRRVPDPGDPHLVRSGRIQNRLQDIAIRPLEHSRDDAVPQETKVPFRPPLVRQQARIPGGARLHG